MAKDKIHHRVEEQARIRPDQIAVKYKDDALTYAQLNAQANQFAYYLQSRGVKQGDLVPIYAPKSLQLMVAVLGALKAGAAYVPMNLENPSEVTKSILSETTAKFVCTTSLHSEVFADFEGIEAIVLDHLDEELSAFSGENLELSGGSSFDSAYVIYTSGTTGAPKGVEIEHKSLLPTYESWKEIYELTPDDVHLQMANVGFDVFAGDWIRALCSGGTLVMAEKASLLDPKALYEQITEEKVTCAEFVPAVLRLLLAHLKKNDLSLGSMRLLLCGSDQWTMSEYRETQAKVPHGKVVNSYGLTETTIDSTWFIEPENSGLSGEQIVPIGMPFPHVELDLLGEDGVAVPAGEAGELCIKGVSVAKGYYNRPELTSEKFGIDPKSGQPIYRTGDSAKLLGDGNFAFLGRNQQVIKINGKRVNLPDIETAVMQHSDIGFAVIVPTEVTDAGVQSLSCYLSLTSEARASGNLSYRGLAEYLVEHAPPYAIPKFFYEIESPPLTPNGKVDRKKIHSVPCIEFEPDGLLPRDAVERLLVGIWEGLLQRKVGADMSFQSLGGTSLLRVEMLATASDCFGLELDCRVGDAANSVEALAAYIKQEICLSESNGDASSEQVVSHVVLAVWKDLLKLDTTDVEGGVSFTELGGTDFLKSVALQRLSKLFCVDKSFLEGLETVNALSARIVALSSVNGENSVIFNDSDQRSVGLADPTNDEGLYDASSERALDLLVKRVSQSDDPLSFLNALQRRVKAIVVKPQSTQSKSGSPVDFSREHRGGDQSWCGVQPYRRMQQFSTTASGRPASNSFFSTAQPRESGRGFAVASEGLEEGRVGIAPSFVAGGTTRSTSRKPNLAPNARFFSSFSYSHPALSRLPRRRPPGLRAVPRIG